MSLFKSSDSITTAELYDKILFWAPQHSGKTHVALTWPKPLVVDVETRAAHFSDRFAFLLAECRTIKEVAAALEEIQHGNLPCESIIVDSATAIYYKFVELYTTLNDSGKPTTDWVAVNRRMLAFINFVFGIAGKNVIFTAHAGEKLVRNGRDFTKAGLQFVGDQKFRFAFDYVFRIEPKGDPRTTPAIFHVEKSASPNLKIGEQIKGLDYAKFLSITRGEKKPGVDDAEPITDAEIGLIEGFASEIGIPTSVFRDTISGASGGDTTDIRKLDKGQGRRLYRMLQRYAEQQKKEVPA